MLEGALERVRAEHAAVEPVRWLCLDVECDDLAALAEDGYHLIVLRLSIAFIRDRARVLRALAARLREGGTLVVITPTVENTPEDRRHIALDENELAALTDGFEHVEQFDAEGLAVLVLRGPAGSFSTEERGRPEPQAVFGAAAVVTDMFGRVLLGRSTRGMWELPGGHVETGESAPAAARAGADRGDRADRARGRRPRHHRVARRPTGRTPGHRRGPRRPLGR